MFNRHQDCTEDSSCYCDQPKKVFDCDCGKPIQMKPRHYWELQEDDDVICESCERGE